MNQLKKNEHKNMVVNHKLGNHKNSKKYSSKSLKVLLDTNKVYSKPAISHKIFSTETCEDIVNRRKACLTEDKVANVVIQTM